jgi:electron transfer flavoprotein alpha subunit
MTPETILCWSEEPGLAGDLVRLARSLAVAPDDRVLAASLETNGNDASARFGESGAHGILQLAGSPLTSTDPHAIATALHEFVKASHATLVLLGSTKRGREIAGRLAGLLDAPAETGVSRLQLEAGAVAIEREMLSGNAVARETILVRPAVLALMPGFSAPAAPPTAPTAEPVPVAGISALTERVELRPKPSGGVHLETAERIVTVGRGLQKKEDLALIEALATALGASVGCTRPLAAEAGWLSDDHWIGLTGHRVKPRLYVAIGVSGAVQHLVGMRDSRTVVAINKDPNAPIFGQADYRVNADLYAVVPALTKVLREK